MGVARGSPPPTGDQAYRNIYIGIYIYIYGWMDVLGAHILPACICMLNGSLCFVSVRKRMLLWPREILAPVQLLSGKLCSVRCSWEWKWNTNCVRWAVAVKGSHMAYLASPFGTVSIQIYLMAHVRVNPILVESNAVKFQREIWREAWLKAERQLDRWVPARLTKKPHKPSIWCSMASWLFCAGTQMLIPRLTHRNPKRKCTEPGNMMENKKLPRELFLKRDLGHGPSCRRLRLSEAGKCVLCSGSQPPWCSQPPRAGVLPPQLLECCVSCWIWVLC